MLQRHSSMDYQKKGGLARNKSINDKNTIDYSTSRPTALLNKDTLVPIAEMSKLNTQRESSLPITPRDMLY